jgi:hypothetical protein
MRITEQDIRELLNSLSNEESQGKMQEIFSKAYQGDQESLQLLRKFGINISAPVRVR